METETLLAASQRSSLDEETLRHFGYRLSDLLGQGACGKIYSCEKIADSSKLAVKILDKHHVTAGEFMEREMSTMKQLNHENIVNLHQVVETDDKFYLIMDLADRGDLLDFLELHGALNAEKVKKIFRQIVLAVSYCHQQNVVHRDLKLENILMTQQGQVKLADFGFSRRMTAGDFSRTFCGSVAYTAPEVLQGKEYDPFLSDMWSLGVILYSLLFGRLPFDDTNVTKMVRLQLKHSVPYMADTDSETRQLIDQLLQPEVLNRMSMDDLLACDWVKG